MASELATDKGKEFALEALRRRREKNAGKEKVNNALRPAGSSMYFYCRSCDDVADILPETYISPPKKLCKECQALKDKGWLNDQPA